MYNYGISRPLNGCKTLNSRRLLPSWHTPKKQTVQIPDQYARNLLSDLGQSSPKNIR